VDYRNVWQTAADVAKGVKKLTEKALSFADFTQRMGLLRNAIPSSNTTELLGIKYNCKLTMRPPRLGDDLIE
jgi:hypothetical protein